MDTKNCWESSSFHRNAVMITKGKHLYSNLISPFVGRNSLHSGNSSKKVFVNMPSPRLHAVIGDDPEGLTHGGRDQLGI